MTAEDILSTPAREGAALVGCSVSNAFVPALYAVARALAERHPQATADQLLDMIFLRGIVGFTDDLNLPRVGSNGDDDA